MNITKETIELLKKNYSIIFMDDFCNEVSVEKATELRIGFENTLEGTNYIGKSVKATKKETTFDYVVSKIQSDKIYKNFSNVFGKLVKKHGFSVYPTSYGIGVFCAIGLRSDIQSSKNKIDEMLKSFGIEYSTEYSDAGWVFRYKISKSSKNISLIESVIQKNS